MTSTYMGSEEVVGRKGLSKTTKRWVWAGVIVLVLLGMVLGTKVVSNDDPLAAGDVKFNPQEYAEEHYPEVRDAIIAQAVDAAELANAIKTDRTGASEQFAQSSAGTAVFSVRLTGVVGEGASGIFDIDVEGVPDNLRIRVQTGPAINGTDLRDATGTMPFGDFSNQIDYQNAAAALNSEMSADVLTDLDRDSLEGKTIDVVGAFSLINPDAWLITPVELTVS